MLFRIGHSARCLCVITDRTLIIITNTSIVPASIVMSIIINLITIVTRIIMANMAQARWMRRPPQGRIFVNELGWVLGEG